MRLAQQETGYADDNAGSYSHCYWSEVIQSPTLNVFSSLDQILVNSPMVHRQIACTESTNSKTSYRSICTRSCATDIKVTAFTITTVPASWYISFIRWPISPSASRSSIADASTTWSTEQRWHLFGRVSLWYVGWRSLELGRFSAGKYFSH